MFNFFRSRTRQGKQLLPSNDYQHHQRMSSKSGRIPRRYSRVLIWILCLLGALGLYSTIDFDDGIWSFFSDHSKPPLYSQYRKAELALPQHNPDLKYPEGRNGRYLWLSDHVRGSGWGNVLQEHFMNGLLAYHSKRSFVFDNYTWERNGSDYADFNGKLIPSRIPMTALIQGPLAGGPFAADDKTPRSVMKEYFDIVCPNPKVLTQDVVRATLPDDPSAYTVLKAWLKLLDETPENCVEIKQVVFDIWIFGSRRILDAIPLLNQSPMVREFRWSPLVLRTFERNKFLFAPKKGLPKSTPEDEYPIIPGLLALHLRRGDFEGHCKHLARWSSTWTGFNQLPELIDYFDPPPRPPSDETTEEIAEAYAKSCYPSIQQIVDKVLEIRRSKAGRGLRNVFIMTNGQVPWIQELKDELNKHANWDRISSSRDTKLSWEQKYIAQASDMLIGQRAQVFIGNGFSSLTANIVMLRMAKGLDPASTRMWST